MQPCSERLRLGQQLLCFLLCVNTFAALPTRPWGSPLDKKLNPNPDPFGVIDGGCCAHAQGMSFPIWREAIVSICWHVGALGAGPVVWLRSGSSISHWWKIIPWKRGANFMLYSLKGYKLWTLLQDVIYGSSMFWLYIDEKTGLFCMHICIKIPSCSVAPSPPQRNPIKQ